MTFETWLAFVAASTHPADDPGTDNPARRLLRARAGLAHRAAVSIGVALGDFTAMTLSMLGIGALLPRPPPCSRR